MRWTSPRPLKAAGFFAAATVVSAAMAAAAFLLLTSGPDCVLQVIPTYVTRSSIEELARDADVVVIATLMRQGETRKVPTGDAGRSSIRRGFEIAIERYRRVMGILP